MSAACLSDAIEVLSELRLYHDYVSVSTEFNQSKLCTPLWPATTASWRCDMYAGGPLLRLRSKHSWSYPLPGFHSIRHDHM